MNYRATRRELRTIKKVVLFSDYNPFSLSLISRLTKEGHQVSIVTGSPEKNRIKPKDVFQEYHFNYESQSLPYIIKNINPDIALFNGTLTNLSGYIAGITNIMITLKNTNINQLIYLSSLSIFSGNSEAEINETIEAHPMNDQEKIILLGEKICLEYALDQNYSVNILRFSEIYGSSATEYLEDNICTELCQKMIKNREIEIFKNKRHYLLYIDDAVDGLYKVMANKGEENEVYHIVGEEKNSYLEPEIMAVLKKAIPYETKVKVIEKNEEIINQTYASDKIKKLGFNEKYQLKDKIAEIYYTIRKGENRSFLIEGKEESISGRMLNINSKVKDKILPYAETILFFVLLNVFIYFTRSMSFHEVVDVYLLYVVVISLIYGFEQSIFTIMLSVLAKIYLTIYSGIEALSLTNEYMFMWTLFIFAIGTMVGYLKEEYELKYTDMADEKKYLEKQLADIKEINHVNLEVKELYENRLLNYSESFGKLHEITTKLDLVEPRAIKFRAIQVIQEVMNTDEVSIYMASENNHFFRLIVSSAEKSRKLSTSLETSEYRRVFEKVENKEIYINTDLDPDYPMMASGLYKDGHLQSIVMIWSLPFESNNLYQMNVFEVTSRLIESKLNVAYEYVSNINSAYQFKYDNMLDKHSFEKALDLYESGLKEEIVEYSLLKIEKNSQLTREEFTKRINKNIQETDYMYEGAKSTKVLLTNRDQKGTQTVMNRLRASGVPVEAGGVIE